MTRGVEDFDPPPPASLLSPVDDDARYFPVSTTTETLAQLSPPLNVHVDIVDLLDHYQGDEAAMFEMLGKLKDLFG